MNQVGVYDAKTHLPRLLEAVEAGESVVITRHGRPVAKLVSVEGKRNAGDVIGAIRASRKGQRLGGVSLRELINEGRKY